MAKRRKKRKSSSDPLETMVDIVGAVAMGAYTKHVVKKGYENGQGEAAAKAAMLAHGAKAMRRGNDSLIALGGLYGLNSAIRDIEKAEQAKRQPVRNYDKEIEVSPHRTNDNRYAWRLNCEDGSEYGILAENYETREEYNEALADAKNFWEDDFVDGEEYKVAREDSAVRAEYEEADEDASGESILFCRVSLLDNGETEYFWTRDMSLRQGDIVTVLNGDAEESGVIVLTEACTSASQYPQPIEETGRIIGTP